MPHRTLKELNSKNGVTLVEVLVSIAIVLVLLTAAAKTILNGQFLTSYARHKTQAMYAAQQLLEQQRWLAFSTTSSQTTAPVILDTYGNYSSSAGYFYGTAITTITNIDAYRNHVTIEIDWPEQILSGKVMMKEYFATNIANDPISN